MFALAFLLLCSAAQADLFRWVDPETGSVKISNSPPSWYDTSHGPKVEVIRFGPASVAQPSVAELQARWRDMLLAISSSAQPSVESARAFAQLTAELDRADPSGAKRRQDEVAAIVRRMQR